MPTSDVSRILQSLRRGHPPWMDEPGLETPPEQKLINNLMQAASGFALPQAAMTAAGTIGAPVMEGLQGLGEAGAIFPEPQNLPKVPLKDLPLSEELYGSHLNNYNFHSMTQDWPRVLKDKWGMLRNWGGN